MEVIEEYLSKVQKVKGIYVLEVDWELTEEELHAFSRAWREFEEKNNTNRPIVILPKGSTMTYEDHFTFERAVQLLRAGAKIRRRIWATQDRYLFKNMYGIISKYQEGNVRSYSMNETDMEAVDWVLYEGEK